MSSGTLPGRLCFREANPEGIWWSNGFMKRVAVFMSVALLHSPLVTTRAGLPVPALKTGI